MAIRGISISIGWKIFEESELGEIKIRVDHHYFGRRSTREGQNKTFTLLPTLHVVLSNNFPLSALLCVVFDVNNEMLGPMIELVPLL